MSAVEVINANVYKVISSMEMVLDVLTLMSVNLETHVELEQPVRIYLEVINANVFLGTKEIRCSIVIQLIKLHSVKVVMQIINVPHKNHATVENAFIHVHRCTLVVTILIATLIIMFHFVRATLALCYGPVKQSASQIQLVQLHQLEDPIDLQEYNHASRILIVQMEQDVIVENVQILVTAILAKAPTKAVTFEIIRQYAYASMEAL